MKINVASYIVDLNGNPRMKNEGTKEPLTVKDVALEALMSVLDADRGETGEMKFKRFEIAQKVNAGSEVELQPEEIAIIKQRIGVAFGAAVVGPAYKILNG